MQAQEIGNGKIQVRNIEVCKRVGVRRGKHAKDQEIGWFLWAQRPGAGCILGTECVTVLPAPAT
jgi:hypothetical protein